MLFRLLPAAESYLELDGCEESKHNKIITVPLNMHVDI